MRKVILMVLGAFCLLVALSGIAGAQDYPPTETEVGGESVTNDPSSSLPLTGSDGTSDLVWVGVGLAAAGGALVVTAARRRSRPALRA